jgi:hypothetical protein
MSKRNGFRTAPLTPEEKREAQTKSYTVDAFCKAEGISRSMLYKLWKAGLGPRFYLVGTVRRISHEARIEWQRKLESASKTEAR